MKLSKNFNLDEFIKSDTAKKLNITNRPTSEQIETMKYICENLLEPLREHFNKPIIVTSGFRSKLLNEAVNGSKRSHHRYLSQYGAVDFIIKDITTDQTIRAIKEMNLEYEQCIDEFERWIHIALRRPRKEMLKAIRKNEKTYYINA